MDCILCCYKSVLKYVGEKCLCNCCTHPPIVITMRALVRIVALLFNHVIHLGSLAVCVGPGFSSVQSQRP